MYGSNKRDRFNRLSVQTNCLLPPSQFISSQWGVADSHLEGRMDELFWITIQGVMGVVCTSLLYHSNLIIMLMLLSLLRASALVTFS